MALFLRFRSICSAQGSVAVCAERRDITIQISGCLSTLVDLGMGSLLLGGGDLFLQLVILGIDNVVVGGGRLFWSLVVGRDSRLRGRVVRGSGGHGGQIGLF